MPVKDDIEEMEADKPVQVQRLCSEIQLFDLCGLERCGHKEGRFCANGELLARFERISEKDDTRALTDSYRSEEQFDGEGSDEDAIGDVMDEGYDGDQDDWEDG